jgi:hypothetical protein
MDSNFNHRHAQTHLADLEHRAELHRLASKAREERREPRQRTARITYPGAAIVALLRRHSRAPGRARA